MINFSENYNRENFQFFLKEFLPKDYNQKIEEVEIDEKNDYFQKILHSLILGNKFIKKSLFEIERIKLDVKLAQLRD